MKNMIKIEMKRAFSNKNFWISILIGMLITGTQIFTWVLPAVEQLDNYMLGKGEYPISLFNTWIGASGHTFQLTLFFMVLPILACLPFADSCFVERESGYRIHILMKTEKKNYYVAKCIAIYISGGVAVVVPLLVNMMITAMCIPAIIPEASSRTFPVFEHSMWSLLFYTHPFYYLAGYFVMIFMYAGLFALWGIIASFYLKNKYLVILFPFMMYTVFGFIMDYIGKHKYSPMLFLRPDQPAGGVFWYVCLFYLILMTIFVLLLVYVEKEREIYE